MNSYQTVKMIAGFEMKTLLRSWFFRIFAGLSIIGLGIFNVAVFVDASNAPWFYRALPAAIPYADLIILNLGQAIVAVFLASEFMKQDRKNDTVEVIYARSMTNAQYIIGKALGVISVFMILNFIILILGMGFSFLSADSAKGGFEFLFYPILISIPTLVFILGLSFFLMTVLKNQAITFIILLGYIALTIFYLDQKFYHLFDYIAYRVPMMNSMIGGFGNLTEIIIHRSLYFLIGLGLIFFTVFRLNRLPQSKTFRFLPLLFALIFIGSGVYLAAVYVNLKKGIIEEKQQIISLNNKYADNAKVYIDNCNLELEHIEDIIKVKANLQVTNRNNKNIDTLIFSLNPALNISSIEIDNKETEFKRELHLIKIACSKQFEPKSSKQIKLQYEGSINENTHLLDVNLEDYRDNFPLEMFRVRKRFAYLQKNFVCLTSESLWYPISGVTYASNKPAFYQPDFTMFKLKVKTSDDLTAVSQGITTNKETGIFEFNNTYALPKISLLIADYDKYSITVDSVEYAIYSTKGNDFYLEHFTEFKDTMPAIIRELRDEYGTLLNLNYGFDRFSFAEVPIHFALDKHLWSVTSDAVQPEMIFYPEKGIIMEETDFRKREKGFEEKMKENNEEVSPEELQCRIFKRFIRGNLMAPPTEWYQFREVVDKYTYSLIPHYYSQVTQLESEEWPVLNMALEVYLRERNVNNISSYRWFYRGLSAGEKINLELNESSLKELIKKGVEKDEKEDDDYDQLTINDVILAKGDYLFSLFRARYGQEEFNNLLDELIKNNRHKGFSFDDFEASIKSNFKDSIASEIYQWYTQTELPGFLIKELETYKVLDGEYTKYQVRFKIANPEDIDGIITVNIDLDDKSNTRSFTSDEPEQPDFSNKILIPAKSAKDIGIIFPTEPTRMNIFTNISENLPNNLIYEFTGFDELRRVPMLDGAKDYPLFNEMTNENEFIVDNEDEGFKFIQATNESYLKTVINKNKEERYKYDGIHFWNPPAEWKPILRSGFYGKYVRSGMYTKSGEGDRLAQWNADLPSDGYYDVYCSIDKIDIEWDRDKRKTNYNFKIYHNDGIEDITLSDEELEIGWNYMGTFYISPENARVELTNKSIGKMVFADAIKWVKTD
jgi:ABC-type transport system involved in multi-copper enzyme maturation permease subunit